VRRLAEQFETEKTNLYASLIFFFYFEKGAGYHGEGREEAWRQEKIK
jgi:hypothetical protein